MKGWKGYHHCKNIERQGSIVDSSINLFKQCGSCSPKVTPVDFPPLDQNAIIDCTQRGSDTQRRAFGDPHCSNHFHTWDGVWAWGMYEYVISLICDSKLNIWPQCRPLTEFAILSAEFPDAAVVDIELDLCTHVVRSSMLLDLRSGYITITSHSSENWFQQCVGWKHSPAGYFRTHIPHAWHTLPYTPCMPRGRESGSREQHASECSSRQVPG